MRSIPSMGSNLGRSGPLRLVLGAWCLVLGCLAHFLAGYVFGRWSFRKFIPRWHIWKSLWLLALACYFPTLRLLMCFCVSVYIYVGMESVHFHMFLVIFGLAFLRFSSGVHFGLGWDGVVLVSGHLKEGERLGNGILRNSGMANILAVCREKRGP